MKDPFNSALARLITAGRTDQQILSEIQGGQKQPDSPWAGLDETDDAILALIGEIRARRDKPLSRLERIHQYEEIHALAMLGPEPDLATARGALDRILELEGHDD